MSTPSSNPKLVPPVAKIVQIAVSEHVLYCLGDDGSLYRLVVPPGDDFTLVKENWYQVLPPPPYYP